MYFCGRFSISEAILSIAVGDVLFSTGSILVHILESVFISPMNASDVGVSVDVDVDIQANHLNTSQVHIHLLNDTHTYADGLTVEKLILPPMSEDVKKNARMILCWAYMGLHSVNILMAFVLWQAGIMESILKCISYLVISPTLIIVGYCFFLYHIIMLGVSPFYYAIAMYPAYWFWKAVSLFVVSKFLQEIRITDRRRKRKEEYYQLLGSSASSSTNLATTSNLDMKQQTQFEQFQDYEKIPILPRKFDISGDNLKLDHQICLGFDDDHSIIRGLLASSTSKDAFSSGEFIDVAVKTLKVTTPTIPASGRLLKEAHLLAFIGEHESILKFLGVCSKADLKEKLFLVTEYYPKGRLDEFLKDCTNTYQGQTFKNLLDVDHDRIYVSSMRKANELPNFDTLDVLEWAYQISNGMEYLHQKRVIHGCLQAKSIILMRSDTVKIWDLSFARKLKSSNYTVKRDELPNRFPWRWTALECLLTDPSNQIKFSTRSDIWTFGVLLWEAFSLGQVPYGAWDADIVRSLSNGTRLDNPGYASTQIYAIMNACWRQDPLDRPNFALLKLFFKQFLTSLKDTSSKTF